jgi:hypothetical protein
VDQQRQNHAEDQRPGHYMVVEMKKNGEKTGRKAGPFTRGEADLVKIALETMYTRRSFQIEPKS